MLFEIERDLRVGYLAPEGRKRVGNKGRERGQREEAEPDDRGDAELERLQAGGREQQQV